MFKVFFTIFCIALLWYLLKVMPGKLKLDRQWRVRFYLFMAAITITLVLKWIF